MILARVNMGYVGQLLCKYLSGISKYQKIWYNNEVIV